MADLPLAFTWITAVVVSLLLAFGSSLLIHTYKHRYERDAFVTTVCVISLTSVLATVCLLPVDIALVSSTTDNSTGLKKPWATEEVVQHILLQLKIVYYILYSLNAIFCFFVIPFAYFYYEEYDEESTLGSRIRHSMKYSVGLVLLLLILLAVGFFVPAARSTKGHLDLDYFKKLLLENHGERALTFVTGVLLSLGTVLYVVYTGSGLALLPVSLIKSLPPQSNQEVISNIRQELLENQETQRIIDSRYHGRNGRLNLSDKDRRQLEQLQRRERTLLRRQNLEEERQKNTFWTRIRAAFRPFTLLFGVALFLVNVLIWASMLVTGVDKAKNSVCGRHCGFILAHLNFFNPINFVLVKSSSYFPLDYVLTLFLVLDFFFGSIVGISFIGIRFLWVTLFKVRRGRTPPQGLLLISVMLGLTVLAINYAIPMMVAPQYGHFGGQKYCSSKVTVHGHPDCSHDPDLIIPCTESSNTSICTPTVVSTFINRITLNFPFFGDFAFWSQFAFLAAFILVAVTQLVRPPRVSLTEEDDDDALEDEEESLLGGMRRRARAALSDARGGRAQSGAGSEAGNVYSGVGGVSSSNYGSAD